MNVIDKLNFEIIDAFRKKTTSSNSMIVVQFFDHVCHVLFRDLLKCEQNNDDIFEHVFDYFDVIETNDRNMFHLHYLM